MYVLPGLMLAALGIDALVSRWTEERAGRIAAAAAWSAIVAWSAITYFMLVDHTVEHPWVRKSVLGYELPNLVTGRIEGVFGFPYRRGLEQVGERYRSGRLAGTFDSNERDATVEYYFAARRSSPPLIYYDDPGSTAPDYYFFVHRPFSLRRDLPGAVRDTYRRIGTITEGGRVTIEMYAAPWIGP
jgi:hypothetical protein